MLPPPKERPDEAEIERLAAIAARYGAQILRPPRSREKEPPPRLSSHQCLEGKLS